MSADATGNVGEDINDDCNDCGDHDDRGGGAGRGTGAGDVASGGDATVETLATPAASASGATAATQRKGSLCRPCTDRGGDISACRADRGGRGGGTTQIRRPIFFKTKLER